MQRESLSAKRDSFIDSEDTSAIFLKFSKPINIQVSTKNLLDLQRVLDLYNVSFGLMYGTLLGAIREKNFIIHDHDTDLFVLREEEFKVMDMIKEAKKIGFTIGRYSEAYISFVRDGDFIDIYFMDKKFGKYHCDGHVIPSKYLDDLINYSFLGSTFKISRDYENLLTYLYGKDWRTPQKNVSPTHYGLYLKVKYFMKNHFRMIFIIVSWLKGKLYV